MSATCAETVAVLLVVLGAVVAIVVWPRVPGWRSAWVARRTRNELARAFRWELAPFDSRHVDVWARELRERGGRDG